MVMQGLASHGPVSAAQQELSRVMKGAQSFLSHTLVASQIPQSLPQSDTHSCNSQGSQLRIT